MYLNNLLKALLLTLPLSNCTVAGSVGFGNYFDELGIVGVTLGKTSLEDLDKKFAGLKESKYCMQVNLSKDERFFVTFLSDAEMFSAGDIHYINQMEIVRQFSGVSDSIQCKVFTSAKLKEELKSLLSVNVSDLITSYKLVYEKDAYVRTEHNKILLPNDDPHYQYWHDRAKSCFLEPPHEPFEDQYKTIRVYEKDGQIVKVVILLMESIC